VDLFSTTKTGKSRSCDVSELIAGLAADELCQA
jgi:hypothetical protein